MKTQIVLISGKKQSGKDTSCQVIMNSLSGKVCKQYSFADPLKQFLINVFGLRHEQCYGTDDDKNTLTNVQWFSLPFNEEATKELYLKLRKVDDYNSSDFMTARELMQVFGSNICRKMYYDCWAKATLNQILKEAPDFAFITDARFPNELDTFIPYDPIVIRLTRNVFNDSHISETALDDYDFSKFNRFIIIDNVAMTLENKNKWILDTFRTAIGEQV